MCKYTAISQSVTVQYVMVLLLSYEFGWWYYSCACCAGTRGAPLQYLWVCWYAYHHNLLPFVFWSVLWRLINAMFFILSSGTYLLRPPCSSADEPVHKIRGVCWYFIWKWCPFVVNSSNSPGTATAACWCLQFDVLLLTWAFSQIVVLQGCLFVSEETWYWTGDSRFGWEQFFGWYSVRG